MTVDPDVQETANITGMNPDAVAGLVTYVECGVPEAAQTEAVARFHTLSRQRQDPIFVASAIVAFSDLRSELQDWADSYESPRLPDKPDTIEVRPFTARTRRTP